MDGKRLNQANGHHAVAQALHRAGHLTVSLKGATERKEVGILQMFDEERTTIIYAHDGAIKKPNTER